MARNGSGTYSVVNTFVPGNTITAAGHNQNWTDLATEMTNSIAADGQTTITAQLKGYGSATKTAPTYAFSNDLDTGIYRIGSNNLGISCGDTKIIDITTSGAVVTGTFSATGGITGGGSIPIGTVLPFAGAAAPSGYFLCDGTFYNEVTYAALFAVLGTTYGYSSPNFAVPDLRGRVPAGVDSTSRLSITSSVAGSMAARTLGSVGGEGSHSTTAAEMYPHTHGFTTGTESADHSHTVSSNLTSSGVQGASASGGFLGNVVSTTSSGASATHTHSGNTDTGAGVSGAAHNIIQPTLLLNYIIRAT